MHLILHCIELHDQMVYELHQNLVPILIINKNQEHLELSPLKCQH